MTRKWSAYSMTELTGMGKWYCSKAESKKRPKKKVFPHCVSHLHQSSSFSKPATHLLHTNWMKCSRLERTLCFWTITLLFTPTGTVALLWVIPTLPLSLLWDVRLFHRVSNRYQSPQALAMGNSKVYSSPWESNSWPKWKLSVQKLKTTCLRSSGKSEAKRPLIFLNF